MKRKTIQIYFKGFNDDFFKIRPDDMRRILIRGIIEYAKNVDEFADMVSASNTFNVHHYDKVKNIVTFVDGVKKRAAILPFVSDDLNYDIDQVICFLSTKEFVLNSKGNLIPVKALVKLDQAMFNSLFNNAEKEMLPVEFLHSIRKLYRNVLSKEPLEINTVQTIEKYIGEEGLSVNMIRGLIEKKPLDIVENEETSDVMSLLTALNKKMDTIISLNQGGMIYNEEIQLPKTKKEHIQVLQQKETRNR